MNKIVIGAEIQVLKDIPFGEPILYQGKVTEVGRGMVTMDLWSPFEVEGKQIKRMVVTGLKDDDPRVTVFPVSK